jgi:hypothetical protein
LKEETEKSYISTQQYKKTKIIPGAYISDAKVIMRRAERLKETVKRDFNPYFDISG